MRGRRVRLAVALSLASALSVGAARAEDRVAVRGMYYREPSTRVVQPVVSVSKDLPAEFEVGAHYAVDAITSASIAQGITDDELHTELRHEVGLVVGKRFDRTRLALAGVESREPDYISHSLALSLSQGVWENSGIVGLSVATAQDTMARIRVQNDSNQYHLDTWFAGVSYDQALGPTFRAQLTYDLMYQEGFLGNVYRVHPSLGREIPPSSRVRHAIAPRLATYFPTLGAGVQVHYRVYFDHWLEDARDLATEERPPPPYGRDPWGMLAHTGEARIYKELGRDVDVRASYRFHSQGRANFYCDNENGRVVGFRDCYGMSPIFHSVDEKLGEMWTHMPELKVYWTPRIFSETPLLRYFAEGTIELSYAYFFQETHFGRAHFLQSGYSLPF